MQDLTYSFEEDIGIVEKNCLAPAHSSSSEPHISLLLQQAQHLLGHITGTGCPKGNFSASCKSSQAAATLKWAGHPWTV